jgi:hypothetical protein
MEAAAARTCTAFAGSRRIASGELPEVALKTKSAIDRGDTQVLIFDDATGLPLEVDFRGKPEDVRKRLLARLEAERIVRDGAEPPAPKGPGRPRVGGVAREVTLLPRHWDWLATQPGGASVALRKLVEEARRTHEARDRVRLAQEAAYRFMLAMAGDRPGFEEANRALFAGKRTAFAACIEAWPRDIREHAARLAEAAFGPRQKPAGGQEA